MERQEDVGEEVEVVEQPWLLKHHADLRDAEASALGLAHRGQGVAGDAHRALRGGEDAGDEVEEGGLSRAAGADEGECPPGGEVQGVDAQAKALAVGELDLAQLDHAPRV